MRSHLSALTTLWIAIGAVCLPAFIYLSQGDSEDGNLLVHGFLLLTTVFYVQLFVQSIIAVFRLKYIDALKQYLRALLLILLSPVLLFAGLIATAAVSSQTPVRIGFCAMLLLHAIGSAWIWRLILHRRHNKAL